MKYIITENQLKKLKMREVISNILNKEFKDSNIVCNIIVHDVDMEEDDYKKGLKYDIYAYLKKSFMSKEGNIGYLITTEKKIERLLSSWFDMKDNEYYITTLVKDC